MKPRVFISSTCYDLLDVRAELEEHIRTLGMEPILSGSQTSDFEVKTDANSIQTCLTNVRNSQYLLVILSRRYGPSLSSVGFGPVSATHLEYKEACDAGVPIHFYVRDEMHSIYEVWRTDKSRPVVSRWILDEDPVPLLEFIDSRRVLNAASSKNNWVDTFRHSLDLKQLVSRDLRLPASKAAFERAIRENRIPILCVDHEIVPNHPHFEESTLTTRITNAGTVPAYDISVVDHNTGDIWHKDQILPAGRSVSLNFPCKDDIKLALQIIYHTPEGHKVVSGVSAGMRHPEPGLIEADAAILLTKYYVGTQPPFEVSSDSDGRHSK